MAQTTQATDALRPLERRVMPRSTILEYFDARKEPPPQGVRVLVYTGDGESDRWWQCVYWPTKPEWMTQDTQCMTTFDVALHPIYVFLPKAPPLAA